MNDDIGDLLKSYASDDNSERDTKALLELNNANSHAQLLYLKVRETKQYLELRKFWGE